MSASRSVWLSWAIVAASLALATSAFAYRSGTTKVGDTFGATFTLLPKDLEGSQCAMHEPVAGRACEYRADKQNRVRGRVKDHPTTLHAHWTTDRMLFVVEGVETDAAVRHEAAFRKTLPKEQHRFEAACQVEVLGWTTGGRVRWRGVTGWDPLWPMWVIRATDCRVISRVED